MAESSKNPQAGTSDKAELFGFFGLNNRNHASPTILRPSGAVREPLQIVSGAEFVEPGIDGKGKQGNIPAIYAENLVSNAIESGVGSVVKLEGEYSYIKEVKIPNPKDPDSVYHLYYDIRVPSHPQAVVLSNFQRVDGKITWTSAKVVSTGEGSGLDFWEASVDSPEIRGTLAMLQRAVAEEGLVFQEGFREELSSLGIRQLSSYRDLSAYMSLVDKYIVRSDQNMESLRKARDFVLKSGRASGKSLSPAEVVDFEVPGRISRRYSIENLSGITIRSLDDARAFVSAVRGDYDKESFKNDPIFREQVAAIQRVMKEASSSYEVDLRKSDLFNVATKSIGYDQSGNIVLMESEDVPVVDNRLFYKELKDKGELTKVNNAYRTISRWRWDEPGGNNYPSDSLLTSSVDTLLFHAKAYLKKMFSDKDSQEFVSLSKQIDEIGSADFRISGNRDSDTQKKHKLFVALQGVYDFTYKSIILEKISEDGSINVGNLLVRGGSRIRHYHFSSRQREGYAKLRGIEDYNAYLLNTPVPTLSFPVGENSVRAIVKNASIAKIYRHKESGEILDLSALTYGASSVAKNHMRFGRILNAIRNLAEDQEAGGGDIEAKAKLLINYGFRENGYGLLSEKKRDPRIAQVFGEVINGIYELVKGEDYVGARDYLDGLKSSDNYNYRQLALYMDMVEKAEPLILSMEPLEYALRNSVDSRAVKALSNISLGHKVLRKGGAQEGEEMTRDDVIDVLMKARGVSEAIGSGDVTMKKNARMKIAGIEKSAALVSRLIAMHDNNTQALREKLPIREYVTRENKTVRVDALEDTLSSIWYGVYSTSSLSLTKIGKDGSVTFNGSMGLGVRDSLNSFVYYDEEVKHYKINKEEMMRSINQFHFEEFPRVIKEIYSQIDSEVEEMIPVARRERPKNSRYISSMQSSPSAVDELGLDGGLSVLISGENIEAPAPATQSVSNEQVAVPTPPSIEAEAPRQGQGEPALESASPEAGKAVEESKDGTKGDEPLLGGDEEEEVLEMLGIEPMVPDGFFYLDEDEMPIEEPSEKGPGSRQKSKQGGALSYNDPVENGDIDSEVDVSVGMKM